VPQRNQSISKQTLKGRVAVVTGGGSGIGAACAVELAGAGAMLGIGVRDDVAEADDVIAKVRSKGGHAIAVRMEIGDESGVEAAFDAVAAQLGIPDVLINSAGLNMSGTAVHDMSLDQWQRLITTDLTGAFLTSRRFVRTLIPTHRPGAIINITSIHAFAMRAGGADYSAGKGGQTNLTRTMALETAGAGITVNAIAPGMILTPMNKRAMADDAYRKSLEANIPAKRAGTAEEVGRLALYLASPDAAYITGTTITIDGGLSLLIGQGA